MQNPEICRSQAIKCVLLARAADEFSYKLMLLSIARLWRTMAESTETLDGLGNPGAGIGAAAA